MKRFLPLLVIFVTFVLPMLSGCSCGRKSGGDDVIQKDTVYPLGFLTDTLKAVGGEIVSGDNFSSLLVRLGLDSKQAGKMVVVCADSFDVRKMIAGNKYDAYYYRPDSLTEKLHYLVYHNSRTLSTVFKCFDSLAVWRYEKPVIREEKYASVSITSSLWNDFKSAGAPVDLIVKLSDIYAWTVDFFGLQENDRFQVMYQQKICEGEVIGVDTVRYAVFSRDDKEFPAIMFDMNDGGNVYWNEKGESMRKAFLKAPLSFSRISSGFSYARRNPVTRKVQPHTAIDYAAPMGTPVMSIGDGTVLSAGYSGAAGNMIKIRHNSVYTSAYLHLSKYAKGINAGTRVRQGQIIGYVGSTGRSTGPHLDFRIWMNGTPVNPLKIQSPPEEPLPDSVKPQFDSVCVALRNMMDSLKTMSAQNQY